MSEIKLTPSQQDAVLRRGEPVLVSAGAGSGKTSVIVARLIDFIKNDPDTDISDFVIITFTKSAASELRARIASALAREASQAQTKHMRNQVALCTSAKIGTIHSFCAHLLRQYSKEAGISPDFRIISDERSASLKDISVDKVLDRCYREMDSLEGFEQLVNAVGRGNDDRTLVSLVQQLHANMMSHPSPEKWAENCAAGFNLDVNDVVETVWGKELLDNAHERVSFWNMRLKNVIEEIKDDDVLSRKYLPSFAEAQGSLEKLEESFSDGWDAVSRECALFSFPKLYPKTGTLIPEVADEAREVKSKCEKAIDKIQKTFRASSSDLLREMREVGPAMKALLNLTLEFDRQFRQEKLRLGFLDYSDLEHYTLEMLEAHPEPKESVSARYKEILVDEYQDVSAIQDAIFTAISDGGQKLFMVGDVKQSIYRFRLADPSIFINKAQTIKPISLNENFRSRKEIIDAINLIFDKCMSKELGDVEYDESARLKFGALDYDGNVPAPKLYLFEKNADEDRYIYEASHVADMIADLCRDGCRFGDIAILMRALSGASAYRDELLKRGIPVETSQSSGFFSQPEVEAIINILKAVDNPHNDIALLSTLRICGFSADDLSEIRVLDKNHSLYSALLMSQSDKSLNFLSLLGKWRENARIMTMDRFVTSLDRPVSPNLLQLVDIAVTFENDGYHGLHHFIKYLDRLSAKGIELSSLNMKGNAVHIMSIHKSKGLEYPVVFLCDTSHQFNTEDTKDSVLFHSELGLGPKYVDREAMVQYPTLARNAISLRSTKEMKSEELRLLYVALTRARERLFITACLDNIQKAAPSLLLDANCPLDWLLATDIEKVSVPYSENGETETSEPESVQISYSDIPVVSYPYQESTSVPASVTATELKKLASSQEDSLNIAPKQFRYFRKPDFARSITGAGGSERGSAMHKILQYIDFDADVPDEITRLVKCGFISEHDASIADSKAIETFLSSPLGVRMRNSADIRREFKFLLLVDAKELLGKDVDEKVLLNGVVDCCFEENGEIVIVDYKTDREDRTEEYIPQVKAYAIALSKVFKKKVKEAYLYYLNLGYERKIGLQ